jgi:hypothetical protein
MDWTGGVGLGSAWQGPWQDKAGCCMVGQGMVWQVVARFLVGQGEVGMGMARLGKDQGAVGPGVERIGVVGPGSARMGRVRRSMEGSRWHGVVRKAGA